jgi:hypothetical protein
MSTPQQPSEDELRAAYEAELKRLRVEDVVVQTLVSLVNLGGRKAGLAPGTEDERDPGQLQLAIDSALALLPLVERQLGPDAGQVRNALSQLQMAYTQMAGGASGGEPGGEHDAPQQAPPQPRQPPRQEPPQGPGGGRLWIPGQ